MIIRKTKISELEEIFELGNDDFVMVISGNRSKKIKLKNLLASGGIQSFLSAGTRKIVNIYVDPTSGKVVVEYED